MCLLVLVCGMGTGQSFVTVLSFPYNIPNFIMQLSKSRRMRWAGHVAGMGEGRGVHRVLVGKPDGKRPLGRPRHRWEDNVKLDNIYKEPT